MTTNSTMWPLVIAAAGSQASREWYATALQKSIDEIELYPEVFTKAFHGFCINLASGGSANTQNIRRIMHECIHQKKNSPDQKIIVLLELTFTLRKEVWLESIETANVCDSQFLPIQIAVDVAWWRRDVKFKEIPIPDNIELDAIQKDYLEKWVNSQRFFYSPYAEEINLRSELLLLTSYMKLNDIDYYIFRGNPTDSVESEHVLDTFSCELQQDNNVFDLDNFSFTEWCLERSYVPLDSHDRPEIGHPPLDAHDAFGKWLAAKYQNARQST